MKNAFEIAYKMGKLSARLDGENAKELEEIVELFKQADSPEYISVPVMHEPAVTRPWEAACKQGNASISAEDASCPSAVL